jgi:mycothiol synthase
MSDFSIRPRVPDDDMALVDIHNRHVSGLPPFTLEHMRFFRDLRNDLVNEDFVADLHGRVVADSFLRENRTPQPGSFFALVVTDPDSEHQGIGRRLGEHLVGRAKTAGANRIYTFVMENRPRSLEFAKRQGFEPTGKGEQLSRLDVQQANTAGFIGEERRLRNQGIMIRTLEELGAADETVLRRLYTLDSATHDDVPASEVFHIDPYDIWKESYLFGHGRSADTCWIAVEGELFLGLARIQRWGEDAATNAFTGVAREHRGRGIARALKMRTIQWARENGVKHCYTGNEGENKPMLSINISLGYQMLPKEVELIRKL